MRLTAVIVNHGSGRFALPAARSLRAAWSRLGLPAALDLVVVDQPAGTDEGPWLEQLALEGARVVRSPENDGYAGGLARGLAGTEGAPDDLVVVMNPDVLVDEACLERLVNYLRAHPEAGVVGPRTWLDEGRTFQLPPPVLPGPTTEVQDGLAALHPALARRVAARRSAGAWTAWLTRVPIEVDMLAGSFLMMRRELVRTLGQFLDPSYPLYYEDADLCRRVASLGRKVVYVPSAEIVHFGARSSGTGAEFEADPRARWRASRSLYLERFCSSLGRAAVGVIDRVLSTRPGETLGRPAHRSHDMGAFRTAPPLSLPPGGPWLVELALAPTFGFCAGAVLPGGDQFLPDRTFDWLFEGPIHLRVLAPHDLRVFRAYSFTKAVPCTAAPSLSRLDPGPTVVHRMGEAMRSAARAGAPLRIRRLDSRLAE